MKLNKFNFTPRRIQNPGLNDYVLNDPLIENDYNVFVDTTGQNVIPAKEINITQRTVINYVQNMIETIKKYPYHTIGIILIGSILSGIAVTNKKKRG